MQDELKKQVEADRAKRLEACKVAIDKALEEFECVLAVLPVILPDGRVAARAELNVK